jgi:fructose-1,6-bisphosphatase/inositol monophosphatase family enzyme
MRSSGFTEVVDLIDGTTKIIDGILAWTKALVGVYNDKILIGIIFDACHDERFAAIGGYGTSLNNGSV